MTNGHTREETERFINDAVGHTGDDCLVWPFYRDAQGYGRSSHPAIKTRLAHRIICTLAHGEPDCGTPVVRHLCGNGQGGCVNPRHLAWGTHQQNSDDKIDHGTKTFGETSGLAVLTDGKAAQILAMREMGASYSEIAGIYRVSSGTVQAVCERRTWKHVDASHAVRDVHLVSV